MGKKIVIGIAVLVVAILVFVTWYKFHYSMDIAKSFEVNTPELEHKVLIATQGSKFKDALVAGVVEQLKQGQTYIKVIDVSGLPQVNEAQWNAVVIMHTWEASKPQADAKAYLERVKDLTKVIVLTTSGNGNSKMEGINAITSASEMSNVPSLVLDIKERIDAILGSDMRK